MHDCVSRWRWRVSVWSVCFDWREACLTRGVIGSTMGAYPRGTGSNPIEGDGHFFPSCRQLYLSSFSDTHTHTHTHTHSHTHMRTHLHIHTYWYPHAHTTISTHQCSCWLLRRPARIHGHDSRPNTMQGTRVRSESMVTFSTLFLVGFCGELSEVLCHTPHIRVCGITQPEFFTPRTITILCLRGLSFFFFFFS